MPHELARRWLCAAYGRALYAYPQDFRRRFGREMAQLVNDRARAAVEQSGLRGLTGLAFDLARDWIETGIREGFAAMNSETPLAPAAAPADSGVPLFYLCDERLPRPAALANGAILAGAMLLGVCLLLAHGGGFPSVLTGSKETQQTHLLEAHSTATPVDLHTRLRVPSPKPLSLPLYFRLLAVVSALDTNHDGVISPMEIESAPTVLARLDANRDGRLDADECGGHFAGLTQTADPTAAQFVQNLMAFDRNRDGKLQREEVPPRLREIFDRGVAPKSEMTVDELRAIAEAETAEQAAQPMDAAFLNRARLAFMRIHPILAVLDSDHNGEISADELRNAAVKLRTLDRNQDGMLTVEEILPDPVDAAAAQFIAIYDTANRGALTRSEWTTAFGPRLRQTLTRAGRKHAGVAIQQEIVRLLRTDPEAYHEMLHATRQGFALLAAPGTLAKPLDHSRGSSPHMRDGMRRPVPLAGMF